MSIKVYGREHCVWCDRLKKFLDENNVEFEYIGLDSINLMEFKEDHPEIRSVPAVFVDGDYIGGYTEYLQMHELIK